MAEIIHVDFNKKRVTAQIHMLFDETPEFTSVPDMSSLEAYLDSLRAMGAEEDDIIDIREAINDYEAYKNADDEIQSFADGWISQFL
jgi:hypothetical protein